MNNLSVIIITKNEAEDIRRCLESVKWADEIIVLDSGSQDETVAICREYTDKVFETDWPGYGEQKNRALAKATGDWVLSLDADEVISDTLIEEMKAAITDKGNSGYMIPFRSSFCGKWIKFGDWRGEAHLRLFRRNVGQFSSGIHEELMVEGKIGALINPILHESVKVIMDAVDKMDRYSTDSATMRFKDGQRSSFAKPIVHSLWAFVRCYLVRLGFLDGKQGFMLAVAIAEGTYYRYLKLWQLCQQNKSQ